MAQMKEQIKAPEIIQLSKEEIANLSDAQFKTLVIRKLTELVEFVWKLDEKTKAMLRETKENVQGTNSDGKETGTQINGMDQKEKRNTNIVQMKEHIKAPEKIQLSNEEIANLSDADAQFKTLVIMMLTALVEYGHKIRGKNEDYKKSNKGKYTGNQQWREGNWDSINSLEQKEEINTQVEQNEETRIQKNEERLRNLQNIFKHSNIQIIGVPEEEEQEYENLFENIVKENFPIWWRK